MVQDDRPAGLDGVQVKFDDERVVCDAGVMLVATLAERLGIEALAQRLVRLRRDGAGAANAGRKVMALVYAMVLGADSIDDTGLLRAGRTRRLLGGWVPAPSTLGTFLRAFTFGHVRQLDALLGQSLERAWAAGAGPGSGRLVIDVDSFVGEVCGRLKQGAGYGYTHLLGYHPILATRADTREARHIRLRKGSANTQRGIERFTDELIARVTRAGATGVKLLRADSGFWNSKVFKRLEKAGWQYSIGIRMIKNVLRRVHIPKPGRSGETRPLGIPAVRLRTVTPLPQLHGEPFKEGPHRLSTPILDRGDTHTVEPGGAPVSGHVAPRPPHHIAAGELVVKSVEPTLPILLGAAIQHALESTNLVHALGAADGPSRSLSTRQSSSPPSQCTGEAGALR